MPKGKVADFKTKNNIKSVTSTHHQVVLGQLNNSPKNWVAKTVKPEDELREIPADEPEIETLANELFRVIIPHQPETRILEGDPRLIIIEEVDGYRKLPKNEATKFENGTYTGLGQALTCAWFFQEIDLKNGNIGLDRTQRVIKIDGDHCLTAVNPHFKMDGNNFPISQTSLESLPVPKGFYTFNWLDFITAEKMNPTTELINAAQLKTNPTFLLEKNQAILKICSLPDVFIEHLVKSHITDKSKQQEIITLLKTRRNLLRQCALENKDFQQYATSNDAQKDATDLISHLNSFTADGDILITDSAVSTEISTQINASLFNINNITSL